MEIGAVFASTKTLVASVISDNFVIKAFVGSFAYATSLVVGTGNQEIIKILLAVYAIDAVCGVARAVRARQFSSNRLIRGAFKLAVYFTLVFLGAALDRALHTGQVITHLMFAYIIVTDSISILENLHLMGFNVPDGLVKFLRVSQTRINKKFEESSAELIKEKKTDSKSDK